MYDKIKQVRQYLAQFYLTLASNNYFSSEDHINFIMERRGYSKSPFEDEMYEFLSSYRPIVINSLSDVFMFFPQLAVSDEVLFNAGLITDKKEFTLKGGYIFPVFNFGYTEIIGLVGWMPFSNKGKYKYTATLGFNTKVYYFNPGKVLQCSYSIREPLNGVTFMVEGIFDTISIASLGLPAVGNFGLEQSNVKMEILRRFKKVVFIPDNDEAGYKKNPISGNKGVWSTPNQSSTIILPKGIKDADDLIKNNEHALDILIKGAASSPLYRVV